MLPPCAVLALNGLLHFASTLVTGTYSPGLVTGLAVYAPLGAVTFWRARRAVPRAILGLAVAAGVLAHALVAWLAFGP